jgi:hypothetical protein
MKTPVKAAIGIGVPLAILFGIPVMMAQFSGSVPVITNPSGANGQSFITPAQLATQGPLTLQVAQTGVDTGNCVSSPCATMDYARSQVPPGIQDHVEVQIDGGTYTAGAYVAGFTFSVNQARPPTSQTTGPSLAFKCLSYPLTTLATGMADGGIASATQGLTGTLGSGNPSTWGTFTVTGAGWTTNDLAHHLVEITGGTGAGTKALIDSNTNANPGVATIAGIWPVTPDATSSFAIVDPGCTVNGILPRPPGALGIAYSATAGSSFFVTNNSGMGWRGGGNNAGTNPYVLPAGTFEPPISIEGFKFTDSSANATGVGISGESYAAVRYSSSANIGEFVEFAGIGGGVWIESNYCANSNSATSACFRTIGNDANAAGNMYLRIFGNILVGSGRGMILRGGTGYVIQNDMQVTGASGAEFVGAGVSIVNVGNHFSGSTIGLAITAGAAPNMNAAVESNQDTFTNCTTAVGMNSGKLWFNAAQLGSGNTTGLNIGTFAGQNGPAFVEYSGATTMTSTTDITMNGANYTLTQLRAAGGTQKSLVDVATGSLVHED